MRFQAWIRESPLVVHFQCPNHNHQLPLQNNEIPSRYVGHGIHLFLHEVQVTTEQELSPLAGSLWLELSRITVYAHAVGKGTALIAMAYLPMDHGCHRRNNNNFSTVIISP